MSNLPHYPKCNSEYTYEDGNMFIFPECANEWSRDAAVEADDTECISRDANGNVLNDSDTVAVIKDLQVRGSSSAVKIGAMQLKSRFVRKA